MVKKIQVRVLRAARLMFLKNSSLHFLEKREDPGLNAGCDYIDS